MKKLLKTYDLSSVDEYYMIVIESHVNGQKTQAKEQFKAMPKDEQKALVKMLQDENYSTELQTFFFDLL